MRAALVMILCFALAAPAVAQSSLGTPNALPPPQRPGGATPAPPSPPAPPPAAPRPPAAPTAPRPPAQANPTRPATPPAARPPRVDAQPSGQRPRAAAGQPARSRTGPAAAAAAAAGAAAAARPPEPAPPPEPPAPTIGAASGLPLPRFASLRSDEVNMRAGPGTRFPIEWTYRRRDLPVQIVREFDLWRRIRDRDGQEGWVHQSTLAPRRGLVVLGAAGSEVPLRRRAEDSAAPVARLRPGVVGRLRTCEGTSPWCEAQVGEYRGWLRRTEIYGVGAQEDVR